MRRASGKSQKPSADRKFPVQLATTFDPALSPVNPICLMPNVSELMALVDALETQLAASRATAENLLAAVVAELTEGTHASPAS